MKNNCAIAQKIENTLSKFERVAISGAGAHTKELFELFPNLKQKTVAVFAPEVKIPDLEGVPVKDEKELNGFDYGALIISSKEYEIPIYQRLLKQGIPDKKIITLYNYKSSFLRYWIPKSEQFWNIIGRKTDPIHRFLANIFLKPMIPLLAKALKIGVMDLKTVSKVFSQHDLYVFKKHYYLSVPDSADRKFQSETSMPGVKINEETAFYFLDKVFSKYKKEFNEFPVEKPLNHGYYLINGNFMAIDGNVYYSMIRYLNPGKIIEIGSGNSTLLALSAIRKNMESGGKTDLICIEPYRGAALRKLGLKQLIEKKVQEVKAEFFESLEKNDILFIDSSHVLRTGNDVWWEYCEILPRLKSGVYVHIHDISLPKPYPECYFDQNLFFNEQYVLQTFLAFNDKFEVIWPGNYMITGFPERIRNSFLPEYDLMREKYPFSEPSSFWMRVR